MWRVRDGVVSPRIKPQAESPSRFFFEVSLFLNDSGIFGCGCLLFFPQ